MKFMLWIILGLGIVLVGLLSRFTYDRLLRKAPGAVVRLGKAWGRTTDRYLILRALNTFFYVTGILITLLGVTLGITSLFEKDNVVPPPAVTSNNVNTVDADEVFRLVNVERKEAGRKELKIDNRLVGIAQARLNDMTENQYYAHQSPSGKYFYDLFPEYLIASDFSCENLDIQFTIDEAFYIHDWLTSTRGHKECLLSDKVTSAGYAAGLFNDENGQKLYLVVGIHSSSISTADPARARTLESLLP